MTRLLFVLVLTACSSAPAVRSTSALTTPSRRVCFDVPLCMECVDGGPVALDAGPRDTGARDAGPDMRPAQDAGPAVVLPSFPGAEGFGAVATGGSGGRVIRVTTLATSGPGSLQAAVDESGSRIVQFAVSGVINAEVHITRGDLTIDGASSPTGITVRGIDFTEEPFCDQSPTCLTNARKATNVVIRHLRSRPAGGSFPDGLRIRAARRIMIDHCSIANASDEAVEISYSSDVTIQHSIIAESLGSHEYNGMLLNYTAQSVGLPLDRITVHHNAFIRLERRFPEMSRESPEAPGTTLHAEFTNNLFYDVNYYADVNSESVSPAGSGGRPIFYQLNWVGNLFFVRPGFPYGTIHLPLDQRSSVYMADNAINLYPDRTDWETQYCCSDFRTATVSPAALPFGRATRHPFPPITLTASSALRAYMVANVGAFPQSRDTMDRRLMRHVAAGTFDSVPRDANPSHDALVP